MNAPTTTTPTTPPTTTTPTTPPTTTTPTTPPAEPFYKAWNLDADAAKFVSDRGFTDPAAMVKSHINADRVATSRNVLERPDPAKLEEWKGWTDLGWVAEPDKYQLKAPEVPKGLEYSKDMFEQFSKAAHEARVPLPLAQKIHDHMWGWLTEQAKGLQARGAASLQELEGGLRKEWGGDYDRNRTLAQRAMSAFNPDPQNTKLIGEMMGQPTLVKMFKNIGEQLGEGHLPAADAAGGGFGGMSLEQAEKELNKLENDPVWMRIFRDASHPQNADYVAQRRRLIEITSRKAA